MAVFEDGLFITVIGCLNLLISAAAQAQMIQVGVSYPANSRLELPGSGATFSVPAGWSGQYNPSEQLFEMYGPAGENVSVGYEGKSYADAIAYARSPITTSEGIVMTPVNAEKVQGDRFNGEVFAYSGKALIIMEVGAVALVIKTPTGKAVTISSVGLGSDFRAFSGQIGLVTPSLDFTSQTRTYSRRNQDSSRQSGLETGAKAEQPSSNRSSSSSSSRQRFIPSMPVHMPSY